MNWISGSKNRVHWRTSQRKKQKEFFKNAEQKKLSFKKKNNSGAFSKDISHLACISNVNFNEKSDPKSPAQPKENQAKGKSVKKKINSEMPIVMQQDFSGGDMTQKVFLPCQSKESFPNSMLDFDDGSYLSITNNHNESLKNEGFIESEVPDQRVYPPDNSPYNLQNNSSFTLYEKNKALSYGGSSTLQQPAIKIYSPGKYQGVLDSTAEDPYELYTGSTNMNETEYMETRENEQNEKRYQSRVDDSLLHGRYDDHMKFSIFEQCLSNDELKSTKPISTHTMCEKNNFISCYSPHHYLDHNTKRDSSIFQCDTTATAAENEDAKDFVFKSKNLFENKTSVRPLYLDEAEQKPSNQNQFAASRYDLEDYIDDNYETTEHQSIDFINHRTGHSKTNQNNNSECQIQISRHDDDNDQYSCINRPRQTIQHTSPYVIPPVTSPNRFADLSQMEKINPQNLNISHSNSLKTVSRCDSWDEVRGERKNDQTMASTSSRRDNNLPCPTCDAKQKLLESMLESYVRNKSSRSNKKKDLDKLSRYFQLVSKLDFCHHSDDEEESGNEEVNNLVSICGQLVNNMSNNSQSSRILTERSSIHNQSFCSPARPNTPMIDAACSPIKWPLSVSQTFEKSENSV